MKIDISGLQHALAENFEQIERETVHVGVFTSIKAASIDHKKGTRPLPNQSDTGGKQQLTRYIRRKGRQSNPKLTQVAAWVDKRRRGQMFAQFNIKAAHNADVLRVADEFAQILAEYIDQGKPTLRTVRRLENTCQALVRNPILAHRYGKNKPSTIKNKGFDAYGIATGTLFDNITAVRVRK